MRHDTQPPVRQGAQSIERALQLLRLVAAHHGEGLGLQQLVEASGLERTTVYRIVCALEHAGLVQREAHSTRYSLGVEAMALGAAAMQNAPLVAQCRPMMLALARRSGDPVFLVVRSGDYSHCLHLETGARPIRSFAQTVGSTRLLGLGIPSFALLAQMSDAAIAAHYERHASDYQEQGMSLAKLQRWVLQARTQGFAQIAARGMGGVGVTFPMGSCGEAALGIVTLASRMPRARGPSLAALMHEEMQRWR